MRATGSELKRNLANGTPKFFVYQIVSSGVTLVGLRIVDYRRVARLLTNTRSGGDTEAKRPTFVGVTLAVILPTPWIAGFQPHTAVAVGAAPEVETALQLGIRLPL